MAPKRRLFLAAGDDGGAPPGKRLRVAAGPGGGGEPPSLARRLLRQTMLVVLFLIRASDRHATGSISQIGRVVREEVRRCLDPIVRGLVSKLESIEERIQFLTHKVDQITPSRLNHHNHQQLMHDSNQQRTIEEGSATNKGKDKSTSVRLCFLDGMKTPIYHDEEIKADSNASIKIGIFDGENMIKSGTLSKVRVEIVALEGNFHYDVTDSWTAKEFNEHRAGGRDGKGNVLAGKCTVQLINGVASLGSIKFREGSCRARNGMFIVGARVCDGVKTGVRVQEAIMNPVVVQDRRNKPNEKSHPPKLDDKVHRLEEIANDGIYCKRLQEKDIFTVQDFLRALNKDPDNLAKVLHIKKEHKPWEKMVRHARECCLEGKHELKSYRNAYGNVELFFNCVHYLVGAAFDGGYIASDKFNPAQRAIADKLKERAYDELEVLPFDYIMEGGSPVPNFMNANAGAGPSSFMSGASQPYHSAYHAAHRVQGIEAVEGLSHAQIESTCANANNDPCSTTPDHRNTHNYQDQGTRPSSQEQFSLASLIDCHQNPLGRLNSSHGTTEGFYSGAGAEDDELALLNQQFAVNQPCCVAPGFDLVEIQRQLFLHRDDVLSTSTHSNTTLAPQQFTSHGAPGPAQVSMQSQSQAPLPNNGPSEASTSNQNQSNLAPQQWSRCHGSMPWDRFR